MRKSLGMGVRIYAPHGLSFPLLASHVGTYTSRCVLVRLQEILYKLCIGVFIARYFSFRAINENEQHPLREMEKSSISAEIWDLAKYI